MRKVCVVVASRANYGRVKSLMRAIEAHPDLELQLIVGASTLLYRYGKAVDVIERDGFHILRRIHYVVEGEGFLTQAKSTGLGIVELSTALDDLKPHIVVTVADRFETMATAIAASYLNIPLAHLQGGEISGNIDEKVRHSITKLADLHFPATEQAKDRVIRMGELDETVFNHGCPAMDLLKDQDLSISNEKMSRYGGVGGAVEWSKPYILMVQHPVTTSYGHGAAQISETFMALLELKDYQKVVLWPNIDAGTDEVSKGIRMFRERHQEADFHYFRNFSPEDYARVLNNACCCVGNSSSFIREGAFLGVPAVLVGDRQKGREHGANVVFASYERGSILNEVKNQLERKSFEPDPLFGAGDAGKKIAETLARVPLSVNKQICY